MKICVFGLWHLGCVTAACLADKGYNVIGLDPNEDIVNNLNKGISPIQEPHLDELIKLKLYDNLHFTTNIQSALKDAQIIWITFDTLVDDNDNADEIYVKRQIMSIFPYVANGTIVIISSQLSVGSTRKLEKEYRNWYWFKKDVHFAYSPENLRLGKAIAVFNNPERIIVGINDYEKGNKTIVKLLGQFCINPDCNIIWMSPESAEMTKHALNSFLATEVAFINEIATICEKTGANVRDVELGLKSDSRIGYKAYLNAGSAFSGGTLARDLQFLNSIKTMPLLSSVIDSNDDHKWWELNILDEHFKYELKDKKISVLGLTYKPNTDTLRRSNSVELCKQLIKFGVNIKTYDPLIKELPKEYSHFNLCNTIEEAIRDIDAVVMMKDIKSNLEILRCFKTPLVVIDANGILEEYLGDFKDIKYYSVGRGKI